MQLIVTDIDAALSQEAGTEFIMVEIKNESGNASTTLQLQSTGVVGIFSGMLDLQNNSDFTVTPGENLIVSYLDNDNGNGEQEIVSYVLPVLQTDLSLLIDETGMDSEYEAITEDVAWYKFNLLVDSNTLAGRYVLAENLGNASGDCEVWGYDSEASEALAAGESVRIDANTYTKQIIDDKLVVDVKTAPRTISWAEMEDAEGYVIEFSQDGFESIMQLQCAESQVDLLNLPNGEYDYRIRTMESDGWLFYGSVSVKNNVVSEQRVADEDANKDVFFGNTRGVWEAGYLAKHVGVGEWNGTKERVVLEGRNVIADVFSGGDDASILLLTDDDNGDALFVEDIFSSLPEGLDAQSRIAKIDEIRAGAGDDVVDLTSQLFEYIGDGMTIHGGDGSDVIWANHGTNWLYGDEGDDRIVGAGGNDIVVGGSGDDAMHGGGGYDLFTFCADFGHDTVEQLATGKVTLWFADGDESNWNAVTLTYSDGGNSVKVTGTTDVTLVFGNDGGEQYSELLAAGAFDAFTSRKIFEDKGILA